MAGRRSWPNTAATCSTSRRCATLTQRLVAVLGQVATDPAIRVGAVDVLRDGERDDLITARNATDHDVDPSGLAAAVSRQAIRTPDATAVVFDDQVLTLRRTGRLVGSVGGQAHRRRRSSRRGRRGVPAAVGRTGRGVACRFEVGCGLPAAGSRLSAGPVGVHDRRRQARRRARRRSRGARGARTSEAPCRSRTWIRLRGRTCCTPPVPPDGPRASRSRTPAS